MDTIPTTLTDADFLQESLDFSSINPEDFENLIFHLLDEMGFSNIQWRKGGRGNSATDGGRDLEATFWNVQPAGARELAYWVEVKHRSGGLEKSQVQATVLNAASVSSRDNLVIVTNSTVSNPTLDWVKEFQSSHRLPIVTIWQGHDLELLLRKNPSTLSRFLPYSLSFSGRCKVIESRFCNLVLPPSGGELEELWASREKIAQSPMLLFAACTSELAYGDVATRPWPMVVTEDELISLAALSVANVYPFLFRCISLGRSQEPLVQAIAYILQCVVIRLGEQYAAAFLFDPERCFESSDSLPQELQQQRMSPVIATIYHELAIQCSSVKYCPKLSYLRRDGDEKYFQRFRVPNPSPAEEDQRFLVMNSSKHPCEIGLVDLESYCPLGDLEEPESLTEEQAVEKLAFVRKVIEARLGANEPGI